MPPAGFTGPTAGYQTNHLPALGTPLCPGPCRSHRPRWCSTPTSLNPGPARGHHTAGCQCLARRPGRFSGTQQGDGRCVNPSLGCVCWGKKGQNPLHTPTCLYPEHVTTDLLMSWGALLFRPHRKHDTRTGRQCDSCCRRPVTACTGIRCCLPLLAPPLRSPQGQCEGTRDPLLLGRSPAAHPQPRQTRTQHHMVEPAQKAIRPHALKWAGWSILLNVHLTTITKWEKGHRCTEQYSPHGINETL